MNSAVPEHQSKVPEVTLGFWIIKIAATTLGETAGDALSMSLDLGYLVSTLVFLAVFLAALAVQVRSDGFHPGRYWTTVVATTTVGTTFADFLTRTLDLGYFAGALSLAIMLIGFMMFWKVRMGTVSMGNLGSRSDEAYYWVAIMISQTLGTTLGDWTADTEGLGYLGALAIFGGLLAGVAIANRWTRASSTMLFWLAFVLTRPLGAVLGDFMDKPVASGGLELSRVGASVALLIFMVLAILVMWRRAARPGGQS